MTRRSLAGAVLVAVVLAGCGSASHSNSVTTASSTSTSAPSSSGGTSTTSSATLTTTTSSAISTTSGATSAGSAQTSNGTAPTSTTSSQAAHTSTGPRSSTHAASTPTTSSQADTNVHLPATFVIKAGGALDPPQISAPKRTEIKLTISSRDGKVHSFVLEVPHPFRATVHPGAPTTHLLSGIPNGTYAIDVDHVKRGRLIVGVAPGP